MPAGSTYTPIATTTLGSNSTVTFSSIPSTYTDLIAVFNGGITSNFWTVVCRFNGDSGSNYSNTHIFGDGSTAASSRASSQPYITVIGAGTGLNDNNLNNNGIIHFMNYSNTTTNKTLLSRGNSAALGTSAVVGLWRSTAAINSITFYTAQSGGGTTNLYSGTSITLYGIAAA